MIIKRAESIKSSQITDEATYLNRRQFLGQVSKSSLALAAAAEVKHLLLYHHDPDRTDEQLDSIQRSARSWFRENHPETQCTVAAEGLKLEL